MNAVVKPKPLLISLAIPVLGGAAVTFLSGNPRAVYSALVLPRFAPPAAVYSIAWTVLYLLMGFACYLIYTNRDISRGERTSALTLYGFSLLTNFLWSVLFFRFHLLYLSAFWTIVIFIATALCAGVFYRIRPLAGLLLSPTLAWLVFAGILSFSIAYLN